MDFVIFNKGICNDAFYLTVYLGYIFIYLSDMKKLILFAVFKNN